MQLHDQKFRKYVAGCLDKEELQKATSYHLLPTPGVLPRGLEGYDVSFKEVKKSFPTCDQSYKGKSIKFVVLRPKFFPAFESYFKKLGKRTGLKIEVVKMDVNDFLIQLEDPKFEHLSMSGVDAERADGLSFLESYHSENLYKIDGFDALLEVAKKQGAALRRETLKKAHKMVLKSGYILPLGQYQATHYYPKSIKNVSWPDKAYAYPKIDMMRVSL